MPFGVLCLFARTVSSGLCVLDLSRRIIRLRRFIDFECKYSHCNQYSLRATECSLIPTCKSWLC